MSGYQLEKIFGYLRDGSGSENSSWGRGQAESFGAEFAKKHVEIKPWDMNFTEIKLLVKASLFAEYKEQQKQENN